MKQNDERQSEIIGTAIAVGTGAGVAMGLVLMQIFDNPGFFAVGIAIGAALGTAVGALLAQEKEN